MKKLLLFDIDGTILKFKESLSKKVFGEIIYKVFGKNLEENELPNFAGMTDLKIFTDTALILGFNQKEIEHYAEFFWDEMVTSFGSLCNYSNIELLPGITDLIMHYDIDDEYQLGLLTGNLKECAYMKLRTFDLHEYFPFGAFGDEHYERDHLPEIALLRANHFMGKDVFFPQNTLIIGDSPMDIKCAKANGILSLNVATGNFSSELLMSLGSDYCFEDFSNSEIVIDKINELLK